MSLSTPRKWSQGVDAQAFDCAIGQLIYRSRKRMMDTSVPPVEKVSYSEREVPCSTV